MKILMFVKLVAFSVLIAWTELLEKINVIIIGLATLYKINVFGTQVASCISQ